MRLRALELTSWSRRCLGRAVRNAGQRRWCGEVAVRAQAAGAETSQLPASEPRRSLWPCCSRGDGPAWATGHVLGPMGVLGLPALAARCARAPRPSRPLFCLAALGEKAAPLGPAGYAPSGPRRPSPPAESLLPQSRRLPGNDSRCAHQEVSIHPCMETPRKRPRVARGIDFPYAHVWNSVDRPGARLERGSSGDEPCAEGWREP